MYRKRTPKSEGANGVAPNLIGAGFQPPGWTDAVSAKERASKRLLKGRRASAGTPSVASRRLPLLLTLLAGLGVIALGMRGGALRAWQLSRQPTEWLLAEARAHPGEALLAHAAGERLLSAGRTAEAAPLVTAAAIAHPE